MATATMAPAIAPSASVWLRGLSAVHFARAAGFICEPWQERLLRSRAPRLLLNCARQVGKSQTCAILAAHQALYTPGSLIVVVARAQRQSQELFRKVLTVYRDVGRPVPAKAE